MTGVFFVSPVLSKPAGRVRQLACWTIARCLLFEEFDFLVNWLARAKKYIMPHSGILKSASHSEPPPIPQTFISLSKKREALQCERRFVAEGAW